MCKHTPLHEQIIHAVKCLRMLPISSVYDHSLLCRVLTQVYTIHGYHVHTCSTTATGLLINCPYV